MTFTYIFLVCGLFILLPVIAIFKYWEWLKWIFNGMKWINTKVTEAGPSLRAWLALTSIFILPVVFFRAYKDYNLIISYFKKIELELIIERRLDTDIVFKVKNTNTITAEDFYIGFDIWNIKRIADSISIDPIPIKKNSNSFIHTNEPVETILTDIKFPVAGKVSISCKNCLSRTFFIHITKDNSISTSFYTETKGKKKFNVSKYHSNSQVYLDTAFVISSRFEIEKQ